MAKYQPEALDPDSSGKISTRSSGSGLKRQNINQKLWIRIKAAKYQPEAMDPDSSGKISTMELEKLVLDPCWNPTNESSLIGCAQNLPSSD